MPSNAHPVARWLAPVLFSAAACAALAGCSNTQSAEQASEIQLKEANATRMPLARFAGTVTIDGQPPSLERNQALLVMLYDLKNPSADSLPLYVACDPNGHFEFSTYQRGDGVRVGSYAVLFGKFRINPFGNAGTTSGDLLNNLYNDPDKSTFKYDLTPPGQTDYVFDLAVAGKQPIASPGPHAVTRISRRR